MKITHEYEVMTEEKRPQDPNLDGKGWTYINLEHGGEYPDTMPQAIRAVDSEGRSCIYLPVKENGKVVDSKGFYFEPNHICKFELMGDNRRCQVCGESFDGH